jgi:hypothetical protein
MLKVLLTDNPELESVAIIVMVLVEPNKFGSDELIVILLLMLSQTGCVDADQLILVAMPTGLVTIVGSTIVRGVPI